MRNPYDVSEYEGKNRRDLSFLGRLRRLWCALCRAAQEFVR